VSCSQPQKQLAMHWCFSGRSINIDHDSLVEVPVPSLNLKTSFTTEVSKEDVLLVPFVILDGCHVKEQDLDFTDVYLNT